MRNLIVLLMLIGAGYVGYQQYKASRSGVVEPLYGLPYVVVYGTPDSGWTQKCMQELKTDGINPIFENIDEPDVKKEMFKRVEDAGHPRSQIVFPIIDVNGHIVIGHQAEKILALYNEIEE